jgi:hypothetical protein
LGAVRLGIADHLGWAIAVTASADHEVVDRRRIELIEPGMTAAPIHYESSPSSPTLVTGTSTSMTRRRW